MNLLREKQRCMGGLNGVLMDGGGSSSNQGATTNTTNTDRRVGAQDSVVLSEGSSYSTSAVLYDNSNSSDAVKAIANAGADVIKSSGGAVVELAKLQSEANTDTWNKTITTGAALVDKLIQQVGDGFTLSSKVVDSFQPTENKNTDAIKWAAIAAGVVGVAALWGKK